MHQLDAKDQAIRQEHLQAREQITGPRLGDYVRFPTGELERFSRDAGRELQTSPSKMGAWFLYADGNASFGGSLNPGIPRDSLTLTEESKPGDFWFFHHAEVGPGRRVDFSIPCRVYVTAAEYQGFLSTPFAND